jgi:anti-anti-sigma factor
MSNVHIVTFAGDLDMSSRALIKRKLGCIAHFGDQSVTIVDMMNVTFLDSTFFNALAHVEDDIFGGALEGRVCIAMQHACGQRLFHLTQFDQAFPLFKNLASARAYADGMFPDSVFCTTLFQNALEREPLSA